jgi:VCBS repeat-containing protein
VQSLNAGEALTDHLLVRSADGTQHTVSVTIQGTNDAPTLTAQTPAVIEDGARLTGQMVAQDADAHDVHTFSIGSPVPGLNFSSDGRYVFDPADSSYQLLAAGQTQTLIIPVTVTDAGWCHCNAKPQHHRDGCQRWCGDCWRQPRANV